MALVAVQEVTVWECSFQPNHTYLMDGDKAYAYIKKGTADVIVFQKPLKLDKRGRKFIPVANTFGDCVQLDPPISTSKPAISATVAGSKGNLYNVSFSDDSWHCTCSGFAFRKDCKHIEQVTKSIYGK